MMANVFQRVATAFKSFVAGLSGSTGATWVNMTGPDGTVQSPKTMKVQMSEATMNAAVMKCVTILAESGAGIAWKAYTDDTKDTDLESDPALDLWTNPNPKQTRQEFVEGVIAYLGLTGNTYIKGVWANDARVGLPDEMWLLRPDLVKIVPDDDGRTVAGYIYQPGAVPIPYDPDEVLHLKLFNPLDEWYGLSPLQAVAADVDIQNYGNKWNIALMKNSAMPKGAWTAKAVLNKVDFEKLKDEIKEKFGGAANAGKPAVFDAGLDWKSMSLSPQELDWLESFIHSTRNIGVAYGVAPELMGDSAAKTFANVKEARQAMYTEKLLPWMDKIEQKVNIWFNNKTGFGATRTRKGTNAYLGYDKNDIEALKENIDISSARARADFQAGLCTFNEARIVSGYEKVPGGDVVKWQAAYVPLKEVGNYAEQAMVMRAAAVDAATNPPTPAMNNTPGQQNQNPQNQGQGGAGGKRAMKALNLDTSEKKQAFVSDFEALRLKWEPVIEQRFKDWFQSSHEHVIAAIKASALPTDAQTQAETVIRGRQDALKQIFLQAWKDVAGDAGVKVASDLADADQEGTKDAGNVYSRKLAPVGNNLPLDFSILNADVLVYLYTIAAQKARQVSDTEIAFIQSYLAEGVAAGESIPNLAKRIDDLYLAQIIPNRSTVISRTEVIGASNYGSHEAAKQSGLDLTKSWLATEDNRTRPTHSEADGQEVEMDAKFMVGGADLDFPGDPAGPADEVINCRCTQTYKTKAAGAQPAPGDNLDEFKAFLPVTSDATKRAYRQYMKRLNNRRVA